MAQSFNSSIMKIKLISPKQTLRPMDSNFKRMMAPPLGLLTVAALTPKEHEVYIEDENIEKLNLEDDPDLVGITANVDTALRAYQIAFEYRKRGVKVVLGGTHPSSVPDEVSKFGDAVVVGEAEEVWEDLLRDFENGEMKSIYYHKRIADLGKSPIPRWDLVDRGKYLYYNVMNFSRGCPWKCGFCYNSCKYTHKVYRTKPVENAIAEIKALNVPHVLFIDDNFIGNPVKTKELLRAMIPLKLRWSAAASTNVGDDDELLDLMVESGCKSLFIGFETVNQENLEKNRKYQNNVKKYERLIQKLHERGIMVNASLVFGFDDDRGNIFDQTLDWIIKNRVETVTSHILTPYPGTLFQKQMEAQGRIFDWNWEHYNTANVVFEPRGMSAEVLRKGYLRFYKKLYSFKNIWKRRPKGRKRIMAFLAFNLCYRKFGKILARLYHVLPMKRLGEMGRRLAYGIE